jgi:hypothetical protein
LELAKLRCHHKKLPHREKLSDAEDDHATHWKTGLPQLKGVQNEKNSTCKFE